MHPPEEPTQWIRRLEQGNGEAARKLWELYYRRLVGLARRKMGDLPKRASDEEDVALSAFDSFCRGAEQGRFPNLDGRDDLWQLLVVITVRKVADLAAHQRRQKRGSGNVRGESAFEGDPDQSKAARGIDQIVGDEPSPEFAAAVFEECQLLLGILPGEQLRRIAVLKMEGHTNRQIAEQFDCSVATIERKLVLIRDVWKSKSTEVEE